MGESLKIPYAIRKNDKKTVHISEIDSSLRGLKCNCICPDEECGIDLLARIGTGKRKPHFSHRGGGCRGNGFESGIHKYAKKIISESSYIMLPRIHHKNITLSATRKFLIDHVELEKDVGGFRPDAIIWTTPGNQPTFIEIYYKHKVDESKKNKIINHNVDSIEIDISDAPIDSPEEFKKYIIDYVESKTWLFCTIEISLYEEYERNRLIEIDKRKKEIKDSELKEILTHPEEPHKLCPICGKELIRIRGILSQDTNECLKNDKEGIDGCGYIEWPKTWLVEYKYKKIINEMIAKNEENRIQEDIHRKMVKVDVSQIKCNEAERKKSEILLSNPNGPNIIDLPYSICPKCRKSVIQRVRIRTKTYVLRCKNCDYTSKERQGP